MWSSSATISLYTSAPVDPWFFLFLTWLQALLQYFTTGPYLFLPEQISVNDMDVKKWQVLCSFGLRC